jgi:hypothetical protein
MTFSFLLLTVIIKEADLFVNERFGWEFLNSHRHGTNAILARSQYPLIQFYHGECKVYFTFPIALRCNFSVAMWRIGTRLICRGLFELRVKSKEGIARVFFCTKIGKKIIILHSFVKKSQKTPKNEFKIAKSRMSEVTNDVTF